MEPRWQLVPTKGGYWNPKNHGFNSTNAKMICRHCRAEFPFDLACEACGNTDLVLATGMSLPGIFCAACRDGHINWECPSCHERQAFFRSFHYDTTQVTLHRRGLFW